MSRIVPDLTLALDGEVHGGAYWREQQFTLTATHNDGTTTLTVQADDGSPFFTKSLTDDDATALVEELSEQLDHKHPRALQVLPELTSRMAWVFSSHDTYVEAAAHDLDELAHWLRYATGELTWDPNDTEWH